ncbi:hypothetical protein OWV82_020037 [Melia azedarach]|uniref:Uncharacterized protein n=1 Tax=Melia azedarach TaxID=155640 RepID=A0ACC1X6R9_MELAZ|nr:hypothetical protein OWV82_020037 [Melia azedarach]
MAAEAAHQTLHSVREIRPFKCLSSLRHFFLAYGNQRERKAEKIKIKIMHDAQNDCLYLNFFELDIDVENLKSVI